MYEVEITTPKGILKINIEKLEELELPKEYTEVKAKRLEKKNDVKGSTRGNKKTRE